MAQHQRLICDSSELLEQGKGLRFTLHYAGEERSGFVIRYRGKVHGYLNQCAHVPVELDWQEGDFFDLTRHSLICSTHGAQYHPETGHCFIGPCSGKSLRKLKVIEQNGNIFLVEHQDEPRIKEESA
jgi:nitrite reductase/ring-hydroxylating ferredoxin subunit